MTSFNGRLQSGSEETPAPATAQTTAESPFTPSLSARQQTNFTALADGETLAVDILATATFNSEPETNIGYFGN